MPKKDTNAFLDKLQEEQEYIKNIQINLFENFNVLLENQKSKVDNEDIIIDNQNRIIGNQDIIVNNVINILKNQKQIVQNQVTLAVILKTQIKVIQKLDQLLGNDTTESDIQKMIKDIFNITKVQFEKDNLTE